MNFEIHRRSREPAGSAARALPGVDKATNLIRVDSAGAELTIFGTGSGKSPEFMRAIQELNRTTPAAPPIINIFTSSHRGGGSLSFQSERAWRGGREQPRPQEVTTARTDNVLTNIGDVLTENTLVRAGLKMKTGTDGRMVYEDNGVEFYVVGR